MTLCFFFLLFCFNRGWCFGFAFALSVVHTENGFYIGIDMDVIADWFDSSASFSDDERCWLQSAKTEDYIIVWIFAHFRTDKEQ